MNPAFVESTSFSREVIRLGLEDDLRRLQWRLRESPEAGVLERGTGGLRKIRIGSRSRGIGKRGGARIHYLYIKHAEIIYLLSVYRKSEQSTLSADDKRVLRKLVATLKRARCHASR